ncbi:unnamed protein product [Caenorhabditis angaria]|uniref:Serpentine receptor class gamma n=1 Tax=Caenorhabditis angaria TaxID=860376 RepID=A0A9P1ITT5_9PELO|nr:unnamed protein product [Caenorhabditis angaria]
MQLFSVILICGNRLTSVIMPFQHSYFWKRYLRHLIIAQIIFSLISASPTLTGPAYAFTYLNQGQVAYIHNIPYFRSSYFRLIFMVPGIFFMIISNILIIRKISKISGDMEKMQKLMTISTIFISINSLLALFFSIFILTVDFEDIQKMNTVLGEALLLLTLITKDLKLISGPIILLIMDGKIQKSLLFQRRRRSSSVGQSSRGITD